MIYSRPGAWADIYVSKTDIVSSNTKMVIDELTFELQYDYMQRPINNRNLDVYAADIDDSGISLSPYIEISRADKSGRANGRGTLYRTYDRNSSVSLEAPAEYGRYRFVNWADQYGAVVSTNVRVSANMSNDTYLRANYRYMGAMLKTEDIIYVSADAGVTTVKVENLGSEEMEWTAVSNDSWLRITAGEEGSDDGYISLEFDANPLETERTGSLTITTDDGEQSAIVYVVQTKQQTTNMTENYPPEATKIYPNPVTDNLYIENAGTTDVLVTDALGRTIYRTVIINSGSIPIGNWNNGLYIITLRTEKNSSVHKVIKR